MVPADGALVLVVTIVAVAGTGRASGRPHRRPGGGPLVRLLPHPALRLLAASPGMTTWSPGSSCWRWDWLSANWRRRGRRHRDHARQGDEQVALVHAVDRTDGHGSGGGLDHRHGLGRSRASPPPPPLPVLPRAPPGPSARITPAARWPSARRHGTPTTSDCRPALDLPVRSGGWLLGHFVLTPIPGSTGPPPERLLVAVTIADQVGVALAGDRPSPTGPGMNGPAAPATRLSPTTSEVPMVDLLYIVTIIGFFALMVAFVRVLRAHRGQGQRRYRPRLEGIDESSPLPTPPTPSPPTRRPRPEELRQPGRPDPVGC